MGDGESRALFDYLFFPLLKYFYMMMMACIVLLFLVTDKELVKMTSGIC